MNYKRINSLPIDFVISKMCDELGLISPYNVKISIERRHLSKWNKLCDIIKLIANNFIFSLHKINE